MPGIKSVLGAIGALVPVAYCGGLLYYFIHNSGSIEDAKSIGLGPTLLGLAIVGGLFLIGFLVRVAWMIYAAAGSAEPTTRSGTRPSPFDSVGDGDFDADAVVSRYMAQRPNEPDAPPRPSAPPSRPSDKPATFGRRVR